MQISDNSCNSWTVSLKLWGTGKPRREFLYVNDLADAVVFLVNNYDAKDLGEFVNIGTGEDLSIHELVALISRVVGFKGKIEYDISKPDGLPREMV